MLIVVLFFVVIVRLQSLLEVCHVIPSCRLLMLSFESSFCDELMFGVDSVVGVEGCCLDSFLIAIVVGEFRHRY